MTTSIGKVLTVLTAVAAVLFATASLVVLSSGPNWQGRAAQVTGYSFSRTGGETPQWQAIEDATGDVVKTGPTLADVIPAALEKKVSALNAEVTALEERETGLTQGIEIRRNTRDADAAMLEARIVELRGQIEQTNEQTARVGGQLAEINQQVEQVEAVVADRRGDVFRLQTVLERSKLDGSRAERLRGQLSDLIVQLEADLEAARARRRQMAGPEAGGDTLTGPATAPAVGKTASSTNTGESR